MYNLEWTDQAGTVHVWVLGTGETVCGRSIGMHTDTPTEAVCEACAHVESETRR